MALRTDLPKIITATVPGPKSQELIDRRHAATPKAIGCAYPLAVSRAEGAIIEDLDGNKFLDFIGGVGVMNIGYTYPEVVAAVKEQADKYFHVMFNIGSYEGYIKLAEVLCDAVPVKTESGAKQAFFANSGAECDENAVKIAKAYTGRPNIIVFSGAFHGRTLLTMAMTAKKAYAVGMGPFPDGVYRAQFPNFYRAKLEGRTEEQEIARCLASVEKIFEECSPAKYIAAIVLEPLQGEGGFIPAPIEFVKGLREICDREGILLIADEVQAGNCRTGKRFTIEYWAEAGCPADIMTTAKSIAAGMPISAIVARKEIMDAVPGGTIGGTYCGSPLSCAAALATQEIYAKEDFAGKANHIGEIVNARYEELKNKYECVADYRGLGAMIGMEFVKSKATGEPDAAVTSAIVQECAQNGLLVESAGTYGNVIRFLAPLVITDEQLNAGLDIFEAAIAKCSK